jgi:magnesium-dependent phosphatase 1
MRLNFFFIKHVYPPFVRTSNNDNEHTIVDQDNKALTYYCDVPTILYTLKEFCLNETNGHMAIASRTNEREGARQLIELFGWQSYFSSYQMYSGCKVNHINQICKDLNIASKDELLFFDDDSRNIVDVEAIGVTSILLNKKYGLTVEDCINGLKKHDLKLSTL